MTNQDKNYTNDDILKMKKEITEAVLKEIANGSNNETNASSQTGKKKTIEKIKKDIIVNLDEGEKANVVGNKISYVANRFTKTNFIVNSVIAVAAVAVFVLTYKSTNAAVQAANAADSTLNEQRMEFKKSNQPYLHVDTITNFIIENGKNFSCNIKLINISPIPILVSGTRVRPSLETKELKRDFINATNFKSEHAYVYDRASYIGNFEKGAFEESDIYQLKNNINSLFVIAQFKYENSRIDSNSNTYTFQFQVQYSPKDSSYFYNIVKFYPD